MDLILILLKKKMILLKFIKIPLRLKCVDNSWKNDLLDFSYKN